VDKTQIFIFDSKSSCSRLAVVAQSDSRQAVVRQSSGSRQAVVRQSSGSRQAVVRRSSKWSVKLIIHCAAFETESLFSLESK
jgi:hypothetical protein